MGNCMRLPKTSNRIHSLPSSSSRTRLPDHSTNMSVRNRTMRFQSTSTRTRDVPVALDSVLGKITDDLRLHYDLGKELGRGQFGVIRHCTNKVTGESFACKSIPKLKLTRVQDVKAVRREIDIMRKLSAHPNVVGLKDAYEDAESVHLVMELCEGGELFDRIVERRFYPEDEAAVLFKTLVQVVKYCHEMGVIHRDLKPENILLATTSPSSPIKVADFGLALRFTSGDKFRGTAGSAYYIAPEILTGQYSEEVDIWSAGVILYILLCGAPPFWEETDQGIFEAILEADIDFTSDPWGGISLGAKDLISRMLCPNPKARITPAEILRHPWILRHTSQSEQQDGRSVPQDSSEKDRSDRKLDAEEAAGASPYAREPFATQEETCLTEGFSFNRASLATTATDCLLPECSPDLEAMPVALRASRPFCPCDSSSESTDSPCSSTQPASTSSYSSSSSSSSESPSSDRFDRWESFSQVAEPTFSEFLAATARLFPSREDSQVQEQDKFRYRIVNTGRDKETIMVDSAKGKFMVVHDRSRRRIGWKCLDEQDSKASDSKDCSKLFEELPSSMQCLSSCRLIASSQFPLFQQAQVVF